MISVNKIKILPEHVANQIAAGEVVEGPSSVVKELLENSIDAAATRITIEIKNQNRSIRIADNGCGISPEDLDLAFKRHATSKIDTIEDLNSIVTNGFRGEALASIAAVSKLTCITKRREDDHAHKLYLENAKEEKSITGAATGTSIHVDELFFNTPARLKFLKSDRKERNNIVDIVRSIAIAHCEIAFELSIDGRSVVSTSGSSKLTKAIEEVFSKEVAKGLSEISYNTGEISVSGYTSQPHITRSDRRGIFIVLNNRILKCNIVKSAIDAVYKELLSPNKYPVSLVIIRMPQEYIDVNVHPNKKEVKYKDTNRIYTTVGDAIRKALADSFYSVETQYQIPLKVTEDAELDQPLNDTRIEQKNFIDEIEPLEIKRDIIEKRVEEQKFIFEASADDYKSDEVEEEKLGSSIQKKFIARLGSIDINVMNTTGLKTVVSSQGNKTSFEIVAADEDRVKSVILRGDFVGENWIKDKYLSFIESISKEILKSELEKDPKSQKTNRSRPANKPPQSTLEKVWERDHYTCVYCSKLLLHPKAVKIALEKVKELAQGNAEDQKKFYKTHINKENQEVTINTLNEHVASYDHHLPASKYGFLNTDERNLYACCPSCNKEKSNSLATKTWKVQQENRWAKYSEEFPAEIAGMDFTGPKSL